MVDSGGLMERIRVNYPKMSNSYRKVARYVVDNYRDLAFLTAAKLSEKIGVSVSVVTRFASALGYAGYPEMQKAAQEMVKAELAPIDRLISYCSSVGPVDNLVEGVFRRDMENLNTTLQKLDQRALHEVAKALAETRAVWIIGLWESAPLASLAAAILDSLLPSVTALTHGGTELFEQLLKVEKGDVVIGVSFPRYALNTLEALEYAKRAGALVVAITDSNLSPAAQIASIALVVSVDMVFHFNSYTAAVALVNALIAHVVRILEPETVKARLLRLEEQLAPYHLWYTPRDGCLRKRKREKKVAPEAANEARTKELTPANE